MSDIGGFGVEPWGDSDSCVWQSDSEEECVSGDCEHVLRQHSLSSLHNHHRHSIEVSQQSQ